MQINFSEIPGFSNLFLDYIYEFDNCKIFFKRYFRDADKYSEQFEARITPDDTLRVKLRAIIAEQYSSRNPSKLTIQNINSISEENTIAVITEVQPFLFGGPLSVIYKIISALKLTQKLKEEFDDYNFIPVVWIERENVDLYEILSYSFIDANNSVKTLYYEAGNDDYELDALPENIIFSKNISSLKEKILDAGSFADKLLEHYKPGKSLTEAFADYIFSLFDELGAVLFNPSGKEVKTLLAPVFRQELINFREHSEKLVEATALLDERYEADEKLVPLNLFVKAGGQRLLMEPVGDEFRLHTKRKRISEDEILSIIKNEPERISPAPLLLPVCQNYLFQTGFRITSPREISRLAQSEPLYDFYEIELPFIYPSVSATLLEEKTNKALDQINFSVRSVFLEETEIENFVSENSEEEIDEYFNRALSEIAEAVAELYDRLKLSEAVSESDLRNIINQTTEPLEMLRDKIKHSEREKARDGNVLLNEIRNSLYPTNTLQERKIGAVYFLNKYGNDFLKLLLSELNVAKTEHQIVKI